MKTQSLSLPLPKSISPCSDDDWGDRRLLREAEQDHKTFAALYRRHVNRVYRFLMARVGNVEDAQDLTAQTFMAALDGLASYREEGTVASWLLGIAHNKCLEHFRRQRKQGSLESVMEVADNRNSPEDSAQIAIQLDQVVQTLQQISPERAEALSLRYFSELSHREISEIMGKTEDAVKMLVHRGLKDLKTRMAVHGDVNEGVVR